MAPVPKTSHLSGVCGWLAILGGLAVLLGWWWSVEALKSVVSGLVAMNPVTALAFILAGSALLGRRQETATRRLWLCAQASAVLVAIAGILVLGDYAFGWEVRIDERMFAEHLDGNRMAPNTALNFLLLGSALLLFDTRTDRGLWPGQLLLLVLTGSSTFSLLGYAYEAEALYGLPSHIPMALNTAVLFATLSIGALCARPTRGAMGVLFSDRAGGAVARRMLPALIGIPCLLGWVRVAGKEAGFYDAEIGAALMVAINISLSLAVVLWIANALNRSDDQRRRAQMQLQAAYEELDLRVRQRTADLARTNDALQVEIEEHKRDEQQLQELQAQLKQQLVQLKETNHELAQKNQENETFVYSVSHDLRSPLVNLQGFSKELSAVCKEVRTIVTDDALPPPLRDRGSALIDGDMAESIHFIQTAVSRLSIIIDALLRLSRAGRVEYDLQPTDVAGITRKIVDSMNRTIAERGAQVAVRTLPAAHGDPTAIEQVFANLIGNALNYLDPKRRGQIEIGSLPDDDGNDAGHALHHTYYVRDNGLGIPAAYQPKVFQAFHRLHPDAAKGEGIGLTLVQRIVERHGGRIWVESGEGAGSTFFVRLPAAPSKNQSVVFDIEPSEAEQSLCPLNH